jgi:hypothetical protein
VVKDARQLVAGRRKRWHKNKNRQVRRLVLIHLFSTYESGMFGEILARAKWAKNGPVPGMRWAGT